MSKPKDDGGGAFPMPPHVENRNYCDGMTLRDYFAAKAMQATIASSVAMAEVDKKCSFLGKCVGEVIAVSAYDMADAMIAERSRETPKSEAK